MKIQDIGFIVVLTALIFLRKPRLFVISGLLCFLLAIPLFFKWIFFTGERLIWYGSAFIFIGIIIQAFDIKAR